MCRLLAVRRPGQGQVSRSPVTAHESHASAFLPATVPPSQAAGMSSHSEHPTQDRIAKYLGYGCLAVAGIFIAHWMLFGIVMGVMNVTDRAPDHVRFCESRGSGSGSEKGTIPVRSEQTLVAAEPLVWRTESGGSPMGEVWAGAHFSVVVPEAKLSPVPLMLAVDSTESETSTAPPLTIG